ncbi:MAG TPA: DUF4254 domain-containing protein [Thermoanaerobaculia bacterium]|nr:DUF4254 domain-containing protein [Thermoanaerobaculia bacterium]
MPKPDATALADLQLAAVRRWHEMDDPSLPHGEAGLAGVVLDQHRFNYWLWHEEDEARRTDVSDAEIVRVKRSIDRLNQQRNDRVERLDELLLVELDADGVVADAAARQHTETPGSAFDRLSTAALKLFHMEEEEARAEAPAEHRRRAAEKVARLRTQRNDLAASLDLLLVDLWAGRARLTVYRQFKMYNAPALNPALYRRR